MASATVDSPSDSLHAESLPVVDLRLLSLPELYTLSISSASSVDLRRCDDVVIPKIDRSVFNESAGSRKQTYSRLRLAPRKPQLPPTAAIRRPPLPTLRLPSSRSSSSSPPDPVDHENRRIIACLQELFATTERHSADLVPIEIEYGGSVPEITSVGEPVREIPIDVVESAGKRKRTRKPKDQTLVAAVAGSGGHGGNAITVYKNAADKDRRMTNKNGVVVDAVALANAEDPYGLELRRVTEGLKTKAGLLGFLEKLNGEWASTWKKRKIVDASDFGDALPIGWKLILLLKRREDRASLICSRYISPSGQQFVSCKEVSLYLCSFMGLQDARQPYSGHGDAGIQLNGKMMSENAADHTSNDDSRREGHGCCLPSLITSVATDHESQVVPLTTATPGEVPAAVITIQERVDIVSLGEVPSGAPTVQASLDLNRDSVPKSFDSKVDNKLASTFLHSKLNPVTVVETCTNEYSCEGEEKMKDYENSCSLLGKSYDKQDREHSVFDDTQAKVSEAMDIDVVEHNFFLGKDDLRCTHKVKRIYDDHGSFKSYSYAPHVSEITCVQNNVVGVSTSLVEEPKPEIGSGSGLQHQHNNEETCSEHVEDKFLFLRTMKGPKTDHDKNFGNHEQIEQQISKRRSVAQSEQKFVFVDNMKRVLTSSIADSKQEKGSKVGLSTPSGDGQVYMVNNNLNALPTCNLDVWKPDAAFKSRNNIPTVSFDSIGTALAEDGATNIEHTINSGSRGCVPSCNEQTCIFEDNGNEVLSCTNFLPHQEKVAESSLFPSISSFENHANKVSAGTTEELKLYENSKCSSELIFDFGSIYTRHDVESNLDPVSTSTGNPKLDDTKTCWNSELTNAFGNNQTGHYADGPTNVEQKISFEDSSLIFPRAEQIFGDKNNVSGVHCGALEEPGQKRDIESSLLSLSCNSQTCDIEKKFHTGAIWEGLRLDTVDYAENTQPIVGLGGSYCQPDMWKSGEENALRSGVACTTYPPVQSLGYFPTFGVVSSKDENDLFTDNQKFHSVSGFDGMRSGTVERMEFDFLTGQTNSLPHDSRVLSYGVPMGQGFETPIWLEAPASVSKIGGRHQVPTVCVWCRNEFLGEAVNSGNQTDSIGFMCPTCKAKY